MILLEHVLRINSLFARIERAFVLARLANFCDLLWAQMREE